MSILASVLSGNLPNVIAARIDWQALKHRDGRRRFSWIDRFVGSYQSEAVAPLRDQVRRASENERHTLLADAILRQASKILGIQSARLDSDTPFDRIGIDSLSAVQLTSWLETTLAASVPIMQILGGLSAKRLAAILASMPALNEHHGSAAHVARGAVVKALSRTRPTKPALRIFGFPYSGGNSETFSPWVRLAPTDVEIYGVELPALDDEHSAILHEPLESIYYWLYREIAPLLDVPSAFYGHSLGGWHALGIARIIAENAGAKTPALIAVGGMPALSFLDSFTPKNLSSPEEVSDECVLNAIQSLQVPPIQSHAAEAARRAFDLVRRDLWLGSRADVRRFSIADGVRSLLVFGGRRDPLPTIDKTPRDFIPAKVNAELILVDGGHLFIDDQRVQADVLHRIIAAVTNGAALPLATSEEVHARPT